MTFTGSELDLAKAAVRRWVALHGRKSADQWCQAISGFHTQGAYQGSDRGTIEYLSAKVAALDTASMYLASKGAKVNDAPVHTFIYFKVGTKWHIGRVIGRASGRTLVAWATRYGDTIIDLGLNVKVSHADTYKQGSFYGWSYRNGRNPAMIKGLTPWNGATLNWNERRAAPAGANVRSTPSADGKLVGASFVHGGQVVTVEQAVQGEAPRGSSNDVWFKVPGGYSWSGGYTDPSGSGLFLAMPVDAAPAPAPPVAAPPAAVGDPAPSPTAAVSTSEPVPAVTEGASPVSIDLSPETIGTVVEAATASGLPMIPVKLRFALYVTLPVLVVAASAVSEMAPNTAAAMVSAQAGMNGMFSALAASHTSDEGVVRSSIPAKVRASLYGILPTGATILSGMAAVLGGPVGMVLAAVSAAFSAGAGFLAVQNTSIGSSLGK